MSSSPSHATKFVCSQMIRCAQCGTRLFLTKSSKYVDEQSVRHLWHCCACDYAFETAFSFPAVAA
jgi:hypothetical protein